MIKTPSNLRHYIMRMAFIWSVVFALPVLANDAFLRAAPDIPLAPALTESTTPPLIFDTPAGRIIVAETYRHARTSPTDKIVHFYEQSLPNLGWHAQSKLHFIRGGELLRLEISPEHVHFFITPHHQ